MKVAEQKRFLILPSGAMPPPSWPSGWSFPGVSFPPGWPQAVTEKLSLKIDAISCALGRVMFQCRVLDEFDEDTDALLGQFLEVGATTEHGVPQRLRLNEQQPFSRRTLIQVGPLPSGGWGVNQGLSPEEGANTLAVSVFGWFGIAGTSARFKE